MWLYYPINNVLDGHCSIFSREVNSTLWTPGRFYCSHFCSIWYLFAYILYIPLCLLYLLSNNLAPYSGVIPQIQRDVLFDSVSQPLRCPTYISLHGVTPTSRFVHYTACSKGRQYIIIYCWKESPRCFKFRSWLDMFLPAWCCSNFIYLNHFSNPHSFHWNCYQMNGMDFHLWN